MPVFKYTYDTTNEGKNITEKLLATWEVIKYGTICTAGTQLFCNRQKPMTIPVAFVEAGKHLFAWSAVTLTFTTTVFFLTNMRKKDDSWNYFFGANASSAVVYSLSRNGPLAFGLAIFSSLTAALIKHAQFNQTYVFDFSHVRNDYLRKNLIFENSPDVRHFKQN